MYHVDSVMVIEKQVTSLTTSTLELKCSY